MCKMKYFLLLLLIVVLTFSGCALATVDELYCLPKRSEEYENLQAVVDKAMVGLTYSAPMYGENRQILQMADLDGDGIDEYLIFAKDDSDKPLKILIFSQLASGCVLMDTIEGYGFGFDFVMYAQMDDRPGLELIVGRQVSNQVMRGVSVYRFSSGFARLLMNTSYNEITTTDLDGDGCSELFVLTSGPSEKSVASAKLYSYRDAEIYRSEEVPISATMNSFKMLISGKLLDGTPAVYVTSSVGTQNLVTDIFTLDQGALSTPLTGISISTIDNYYVYPDDMDGDGIIEIPYVLPLASLEDTDPPEYMIQWYNIDRQQQKTVNFTTYHNLSQNWYLELDEAYTAELSVRQSGSGSVFYYKGKKLFTVMALTDADRDEQSKQPGYVVLYGGETVIYVAYLESTDWVNDDLVNRLIGRFHPIRVELNTEEDRPK